MEPMDTGELRLRGRILAGRYSLETEVASGGMATVWRGRDEVLGRPVAVKVLHDRLARDPDILERFRVEAIAAARLSHPNVVRVFDTGIDDGVCFIVMELFEGTTLEEMLRERGPLPPPEAARVVRSALHGLAHAHREGVIHRDVKPGNILIDRSGLVKVSDFGIAKAAFAGEDLTTTGELLGTALYLAPEQIAGGPVDPRTDLYACGVVLYQSLTGRPPFEAETHIATATMRLTKDPPPPGALRPGIPRAVEAVTMRALARDPNQRFPTGEDMSAALDRSVPSVPARPVAPPPPSAPRGSAFRSWMAVPLILVILAALAVIGFTLAAPLFDENGSGPQAVSEQELLRLTVAEPLAFDPRPGDLEEHDSELPLAVDGNPETSWTTDGYTSADFGGIPKEGVGLIVPITDAEPVTAVVIRTDLPGWRFRLYGSDAPDFDIDAPIESTDGEDSFVAGRRTEIAFDPVSARYVMVLITELAELEGDYRARVAEVDLFAPGG
jgi:eukaryotic-like serine/threonine-protein kinase